MYINPNLNLSLSLSIAGPAVASKYEQALFAALRTMLRECLFTKNAGLRKHHIDRCVCVCVCVSTCVCVYVCVCLRVYVCLCMYVFECIHTLTHSITSTHKQGVCVCVCVFTSVYIHTVTHTHTHTHTHIHTHTQGVCVVHGETIQDLAGGYSSGIGARVITNGQAPLRHCDHGAAASGAVCHPRARALYEHTSSVDGARDGRCARAG
jgi:hypothetical protein